MSLRKTTIITTLLSTSLFLAVWCSSFALAQNEPDDYQPKRSQIGLDIYKNIYDNFDDVVEKRALERSLEVLNSLDSETKHTKENVQDIVYSGRFDLYQLLKKQTGSHEEVKREIFDRVLANYNFEKEMANYELSLQIETGGIGQYSNGTLDDSSYDLVVDLNKLDVIFFGEKATLPIAYWGSYDGFLRDNNSGNNTNGSNTNINGTTNQNQNGNTNRNTNNNGIINNSNNNNNRNLNQNNNASSNANRNTNSSSTTNSNMNELVCAPGDSIRLNDQDLNNQLSDLQNQVQDIRDQIDAGSNGISVNDVNQDNTNSTTAAPLAQQDYKTVTGRSQGDSGFTSEKDIEGSDLWPCTEFFCIKVSFQTGVAKTSYPTYDNSIRAHADYIYKFIQDTTKYPLAPKATTREFFSLGFHDLKLADHLHLKVFISSKPVWSPKKYTYTSVNTEAVTQAQQIAEGYADPDIDTTDNSQQKSDPTQRTIVRGGSTLRQDQVSTDTQKDIELREEAKKKQKEFEDLLAKLETAIDFTPLVDQIKMMRNSLANLNDLAQSISVTARSFTKVKPQ